MTDRRLVNQVLTKLAHLHLKTGLSIVKLLEDAKIMTPVHNDQDLVMALDLIEEKMK